MKGDLLSSLTSAEGTFTSSKTAPVIARIMEGKLR